jgi:N-acetylglutamate synthase-like GNAT family acetyltransferase
MKIEIRFAKLNEFRKCKKLDPRLTASRFHSKAKEKEIVVAIQESEIVGYLRLEYIWLKIPYLSWIIVKEDRRKTGIARDLVGFLKAFLKEKNLKFILSSYQNNAPHSKRWHSHLGFKACGRIQAINEDNSVELFCKLKI